MQIRMWLGVWILIAVFLTSSTLTSGEERLRTDVLELDAKSAISAAVVAREQAASVEGEWRDTAELIMKAKAALSIGDYVMAMSLAKEAQTHSNLGYSQAMSQREIKIPSYFNSKQ